MCRSNLIKLMNTGHPSISASSKGKEYLTNICSNTQFPCYCVMTCQWGCFLKLTIQQCKGLLKTGVHKISQIPSLKFCITYLPYMYLLIIQIQTTHMRYNISLTTDSFVSGCVRLLLEVFVAENCLPIRM